MLKACKCICQLHDQAAVVSMPPRSNALDAILRAPRSVAEQQVQEAWDELKTMKAALKQLRRRRTYRARAREPTVLVQRQACLVYALSGDAAWAVTYVKMNMQRNILKSIRVPRDIRPATIIAWYEKLRSTPEFRQAESQLFAADRMKVDQFLMQSLVFEFVRSQSNLGLVVPSPVVVTKYITLWKHRPMSTKTADFLYTLRHNAMCRKNWISRFRKRWRLEWGVSPPGKDLSRREMVQKDV